VRTLQALSIGSANGSIESGTSWQSVVVDPKELPGQILDLDRMPPVKLWAGGLVPLMYQRAELRRLSRLALRAGANQ